MLAWRKGEGCWEAYGRERKQFAVVKEKHGWCLYRYSQRGDGSIKFKSKEKVRTKAHGQAYAEKLWQLAHGD